MTARTVAALVGRAALLVGLTTSTFVASAAASEGRCAPRARHGTTANCGTQLHRPGQAVRPSTTRAPSTAAPLPAGVAEIPAAAVTVFPLTIAPLQDLGAHALAVGGGSVWIAGRDGEIDRIDPATGSVTATIVLAPGSAAFSIAYGEGGLWAVSSITVPDPAGGTGFGFAAAVSRIDPATNRVGFTTTIPGSFTQGNAGQRPRVAVGDGAAWVTVRSSLVRVDAVTGQAAPAIAMPSLTFTLVVSRGAVWLQEWNGSLQRVDTSTNAVTQAAQVDAAFVQSMASTSDAIWVTHATSTRSTPTAPVLGLSRVDPGTGNTSSTGIPTAEVAAGDDRVWIAGTEPDSTDAASPKNDHGVVGELDPTTGHLARAVQLTVAASEQLDVAVDGPTVWVLKLTSHSLTRITT